MNGYREEAKCCHYPASEVSELDIICKNYNVQLTEGTSSEIVIRYQNNRFRKMNITKRNTTLCMEEKMAITFYGLFRFMELMRDNTLEIEVPHGYDRLSISAETGVTRIDVREIAAENLDLRSSTGQILEETFCNFQP